MIKRYHTVVAKTVKDLNRLVNEAIDKGYLPSGVLQTPVLKKGEEEIQAYLQVMIKQDNDSDPTAT